MILLVSSFTAYLITYKYLALFLIVFAGSFIVPVPLNELILVAGAFASAGKMNIILIIVIAFFTNVLADVFGYFLTYHYGDDIFRLLRIKKDTNFFRVKKYLENYAYGTIYFCKIIGPFGPMVNFVSGLINIPFWKFFLFDVLGNLTDVLFFALAGYLVGDYWQKFLTELWMFAIIPIVIFLGYLIYKTRFRNLK
jgi:membrane-associated protein